MFPIELVVSTYSGNVTDPLQLYKSKHRKSDLCLALLRSNQGPEEYTAILAGMETVIWIPNHIPVLFRFVMQSCQESSALNLITSLGIADLIIASPNGRLSLTELSSKTNADERYLGENSNCEYKYFVKRLQLLLSARWRIMDTSRSK